jgi:hypothetical protein
MLAILLISDSDQMLFEVLKLGDISKGSKVLVDPIFVRELNVYKIFRF